MSRWFVDGTILSHLYLNWTGWVPVVSHSLCSFFTGENASFRLFFDINGFSLRVVWSFQLYNSIIQTFLFIIFIIPGSITLYPSTYSIIKLHHSSTPSSLCRRHHLHCRLHHRPQWPSPSIVVVIIIAIHPSSPPFSPPSPGIWHTVGTAIDRVSGSGRWWLYTILTHNYNSGIDQGFFCISSVFCWLRFSLILVSLDQFHCL